MSDQPHVITWSLDATLRVPGDVYRVAGPEHINPARVCVDNDNGLWISGRRVGQVINVTAHGDRIYEHTDDGPRMVDFVTTETTVDCILEFEPCSIES